MTLEQPQFLRLKQVIGRTSVSRATIYRRIAEGRFPQPRRMGLIPVWVTAEVDAWAADQIGSAPQYVRKTAAVDDFKDLLG